MSELPDTIRTAAQETQDRIRKRIKEDLKDAVTAHTEYSENVLPRLKRNYLRKCQEAEVRSSRSLPVVIVSLTLRRFRNTRPPYS